MILKQHLRITSKMQFIMTAWWILTILKNIGQWEGFSHVLWKLKNV